MNREKIVVAMSGGVDSSVAAALCREQGYDVVGLFMRHGKQAPGAASAAHQGCCSLDDAEDARRVAFALEAPFYALNFEREFGAIVDYFVSEYDAGRTPNPCVECNRSLKFGKLIEYADAVGARQVATGHYARTEESGGGRVRLLRGKDPGKDQSYVLFPLSQEQLRRARFPLGGMTKPEVRAEAKRFGLSVAEKPDSQEVCFVPNRDIAAVLREQRPGRLREGALVTSDGRELGRHSGYQQFTIGQRHGLGVALGRPAYVIRIEPETNTVVVGAEEDLRSTTCRVSRTNWVSVAEPVVGNEVRVSVKIRYQHAPAAARVRVTSPGRAEIVFDEPQRAVTPGQAAVWYEGDVVLGGGWIEREDAMPV